MFCQSKFPKVWFAATAAILACSKFAGAAALPGSWDGSSQPETNRELIYSLLIAALIVAFLLLVLERTPRKRRDDPHAIKRGRL